MPSGSSLKLTPVTEDTAGSCTVAERGAESLAVIDDGGGGVNSIGFAILRMGELPMSADPTDWVGMGRFIA